MDTSVEEARAKVIKAADELYEESGRQKLPTVSDVRIRARVDMNTASTVMKEWRRIQAAGSAPVAVVIPEKVQLAHTTAMAQLWTAAQELANESLLAAQQAWELERTEADSLRQELSTAFDGLTADLANAHTSISDLEKRLEATTAQLVKSLADNETLKHEATTQAARATEIERRASDLKSELAHTHADLENERASHSKAMASEQERHTREVDNLKAQLLAEQERHTREVAGLKELLTDVHTSMDISASNEKAATLEIRAAEARAAQAREELAEMRGRIEAMTAHEQALVKALADSGKPKENSPEPQS